MAWRWKHLHLVQTLWSFLKSLTAFWICSYMPLGFLSLFWNFIQLLVIKCWYEHVHEILVHTVKPVPNGHFQLDTNWFPSKKGGKDQESKTSKLLIQVKSIAECSKASILQYFQPSLSYHLSLRSLFWLSLSGSSFLWFCFRQLTFLNLHISKTYKGILSECQVVLIQITTDVLLILIRVQKVFKGYQQSIKFARNRQREEN